MQCSVDYNQKSEITPSIKTRTFSPAILSTLKTSDMYRLPPIHKAAEDGDLERLKHLVQGGRSVDSRDRRDKTPLHFAAKKGYLEIVRYLVQEGASVDNIDYNDRTPLHIAAKRGYLEIVRYLVQEGASMGNFDLQSPLHIAAREGYLEIVRYLVQKGASVDNIGWGGMTPLCFAADKGYLEIVRYLVQEGASIDKRYGFINYYFGGSALHWAANSGQFQVVEFLTSCNCNLNIKKYCLTPLMVAIGNKHDSDFFHLRQRREKVAEILIRAGADVHSRGDSYGRTPLLAACYNGQQDIVKLLLDAGSEINITTRPGHTPLHYACRWGHRQIVKLLLQAGADTTIRNKCGETPVSLGIKHKSLNIEDIKLFLQYGFFFEDREYARISRNALLKENVLKDVDLCTQAIVNKYNTKSFPALYRIPNLARCLPPMKKMKLKDFQICQIANFVESEIESNWYCNVVDVRPKVLQVLGVESLITRQA